MKAFMMIDHANSVKTLAR